MRESIGATYIFSICLTFFVIITAYLAISVNYAKAFKIKSYIVSQIEENKWTTDVKDDVYAYLTAQGYSAYGECPDEIVSNDGYGRYWELDGTHDGCFGNAPSGKCGVCIYRLGIDNANDDIDAEPAYYKVVTFFKFDLPILNNLLTFKVSGDTKYIYEG